MADEKGNLLNVKGKERVYEEKEMSCAGKGVFVFAAKAKNGEYRAAIQRKGA